MDILTVETTVAVETQQLAPRSRGSVPGKRHQRASKRFKTVTPLKDLNGQILTERQRSIVSPLRHTGVNALFRLFLSTTPNIVEDKLWPFHLKFSSNLHLIILKRSRCHQFWTNARSVCQHLLAIALVCFDLLNSCLQCHSQHLNSCLDKDCILSSFYFRFEKKTK